MLYWCKVKNLILTLVLIQFNMQQEL